MSNTNLAGPGIREWTSLRGVSTYQLWILGVMQYVEPGEVLYVQELLNSHWQIVQPVTVGCDQPSCYPGRIFCATNYC